MSNNWAESIIKEPIGGIDHESKDWLRVSEIVVADQSISPLYEIVVLFQVCWVS